jgi:hypothetical protein
MSGTKESWRERHRAHFADDMKKRHPAVKSKKVDEPKPETIAKVQRGLFIGGLVVTVLGVLGLLLLYAC